MLLFPFEKGILLMDSFWSYPKCWARLESVAWDPYSWLVVKRLSLGVKLSPTSAVEPGHPMEHLVEVQLLLEALKTVPLCLWAH